MERRAAPLPVNDWASSIIATARMTSALFSRPHSYVLS